MFQTMWKTLFTPKVTRQDDTHVRVEIYDDVEEVGTLYYERPKIQWTNKPLSLNKWVCVDAHIDTFARMVQEKDPQVTPSDITKWGSELVSEASL